MALLNVSGLTKYYGGALIFGDVSFMVARGEKVALVGPNGAGKSTLLKIIAGLETPTAGGVHIARGRRVAYLAQEARFTGARTLIDEMHATLAHLAAMQAEIAALEHALADTAAPEWEARMERYGELTQRFEHAGGYEIERRIDMTLQGLGFTEAQYGQPLAQFSGGQKTRAALAAALLSDPDLLLLDEPTNHLDLAALEWLERFLKTWDGTLIVISHDRYFLDKVTARTLDLGFGRLEDYPAPYHRYLELKAERLELQMKQFQAQQAFIAKTEEFIRRFKAGQRSKEARGRELRLERLKQGFAHADGTVEKLIGRPQQQRKLRLDLAGPQRSGEVVLRLEGLVVGFAANGHRPPSTDTTTQPAAPRAPNTALIRCPDLEIRRGQRVALIGPNGSGKTTLLRTIVGELPPLHGAVRLGHNVTLTYYAQAHEGLRMDATVLDEIWRAAPHLKETEARTFLGRFLFSGDDVHKRVGDLSGGERSRVALAQLTLLSGNLLVLDEPTNHLDIDAREALEGVLNDYQGTLLFVSHDRYFIDAVADTIWEVRDGAIVPFNGTYSELAAAKERADAGDGERKVESVGRKPDSAEAQRAAPVAPPDRPQASREERKRQRRLERLEEEIAMLEQELRQIEAEMTAAGVAGDGRRVAALSEQYAEVQQMVQTRYDEWAALA
jgi:ATP-binding cassette subfamily F protein 3